MTAIRVSIIIGCCLVAARFAPAAATDDFQDVPFLFAKVSEALEIERTGVPIDWRNPATGRTGTILITRTFYLSDGSPCRDYTRSTDRPGQEPVTESGTGCREADGRWMLKESAPPRSDPTPLVSSPVSEPEVRATPLPSPPAPALEPPPSVVARSEPPPPPLPNPPKSTTQSTAKKVPKIFSTTMPSRSD